MNVYYVSQANDGCYYYRCYLPMLYNGWDGTYTSMLSEAKSAKQLTREVVRQDVVVFQRPYDDARLELIKRLKELGIKIVFDNDDTYRDLDNKMNFKTEFERQRWFLEECLRLADMATTTTVELAKEYRQFNDNVVVLPNYIDPSDWDEPLRNEGDKIKIGFVGSVTHNADYEHIKPLINELADRDDVEVVVMGMRHAPKHLKRKLQSEIDYWEGLGVTWVDSVSAAEYPDALNELRLDMMLIPRRDNHFNRCKSNCKYLEAAMCEIPVIGQGFSDGGSPYDNTPHLVVATDLASWRKEVYKMLGDKEHRREIGAKARKYVLENYNIEDHYHLWEETYKKLV